MIPENSLRHSVFEYAAERYNTTPEYLWERTPDTAVLRRSDNAKWFGIIMDIPKNKLVGESSEIVDVLNVKCDELMTGSLITEEGIFPAWHMNKKTWVSVLLDGSVPFERVEALIDMSFALTAPSAKKRVRKNDDV